MAMYQGYEVIIEEQRPVLHRTAPGGYILCHVRLERENSSLSYGRMYFSTDLERVVTQYFQWMAEPEFVNALRELGYTFNPLELEDE